VRGDKEHENLVLRRTPAHTLHVIDDIHSQGRIKPFELGGQAHHPDSSIVNPYDDSTVTRGKNRDGPGGPT